MVTFADVTGKNCKGCSMTDEGPLGSATAEAVESQVRVSTVQVSPRFDGLTGYQLQLAIERNWDRVVTSPGCSVYPSGTSTILCWKDPGPGDIFNFGALKQDPLIKGISVDWEVDICKAEARCLYLVGQTCAALKLLLYRHGLV